MCDFCFLLSLIVFIVFSIGVYTIRKRKVRAMSLEIVAIMIATGILVFPLYQEVDIVRQILLSTFYAIKIPTMNGNFAILDNCYGIYSDYYKYVLYMYSILAPILAAGVIVGFIEEKFDELCASLYTKKVVHVFSEMNEKSLLLAESLKDKHQKIIFCEVDKSKVQDVRLKNMKAICIKKNISEVNYNRFINQTNLYLLSAIDEKSVNDALKVIEKNRNITNNLTAYVFTSNDDTQTILDSMDKGNVKTIMIHPNRQMVYHVLSNWPLYSYAKERVSTLIVGAEDICSEFVKTITWCGQIVEKELEIHVLDKKANELESRLLWECPELCKPYYDISYHNVDVLSQDSKNILDTYCQNVNYIIVSLGNDDLNLKVALQLRRYYLSWDMHPFIALVITNEEKKQQIELLRNEKNNKYDLYPFGSDYDMYTLNGITNSQIEQRAKNIHLSYATDDMNLEKFYSSEYNKKSSYASALHLRYKLHTLINGNRITIEKLQELLADDHTLQKLAKNEHNRWMAYVRSEGYRQASLKRVEEYMPFTKHHVHHLAKLHPCLIDYEQLDELSKEVNALYIKNQINRQVDFIKSDVDVVLNIPKILKDE